MLHRGHGFTKVLFDTNAVRSSSFANIRIWADEGELRVSPVSAWELFGHLDEEKFERARANVAKLVNFTIEPRPLEFLNDDASRLAPRSSASEESEKAAELVALVIDSKSYADLGTKTIRNRYSVEIPLADFATSARQADEAVGSAYVTRFQNSKYLRMSNRELRNYSDDDFFCDAVLVDAQRLLGTAYEERVSDVFVALAVSLEWSTSRRFRAVPNHGTDHHICQHLSLASPFVFVSDDEPLRSGVQRALRVASRTSLSQNAAKSCALTLNEWAARGTADARVETE